jgi:ectoine hydroxylase-related dioxygenase (phytanoyl-CoA dioxygenase family)
MEAVPDIDADRSSYDILGWALKAGDAVAFDFRTVHGAPANKSTSSARRAFALRLVGDGATFNRLPGRVSSPPFPDVVLDNGAPLDGEQFPLLLSAKNP